MKAYHEARRQIIDRSSCGFYDMKPPEDRHGRTAREGVRAYLPHGNGDGRPAESMAEQLQAIEAWPETRRMRAVEQARLHIGEDIENEELRQRLTEGILLNCMSRKRYAFAVLDLPGISETGFKRRKTDFLMDIADYLGMI